MFFLNRLKPEYSRDTDGRMPSAILSPNPTDCSAVFPARKRTTENGLGRNGWGGMLPVVLETRRWPDQRSSQASRHHDRQGRVRPARALLAASYGHLGRFAEARAAWQEVLRVKPDYPP
jgi:hypothetical protein